MQIRGARITGTRPGQISPTTNAGTIRSFVPAQTFPPALIFPPARQLVDGSIRVNLCYLWLKSSSCIRGRADFPARAAIRGRFILPTRGRPNHCALAPAYSFLIRFFITKTNPPPVLYSLTAACPQRSAGIYRFVPRNQSRPCSALAKLRSEGGIQAGRGGKTTRVNLPNFRPHFPRNLP
jgi:hypothetical protein